MRGQMNRIMNGKAIIAPAIQLGIKLLGPMSVSLLITQKDKLKRGANTNPSDANNPFHVPRSTKSAITPLATKVARIAKFNKLSYFP